MSGSNLPTNLDATYGDSTDDATVKLHQQFHDAVHRVVNLFDKDTPPTDGQVLVWDSATNLWIPTTLSLGGTPVVTPTSYETAPVGSVFRIPWVSAGWPATRPSSRLDVYFELYGAPSGTAAPSWMKPGDNQLPTYAQLLALGGSSSSGPTTWAQITGFADFPAFMAAGSSQAAARTVIGAVALGTTAGTAAEATRIGELWATPTQLVTALNSSGLPYTVYVNSSTGLWPNSGNRVHASGAAMTGFTSRWIWDSQSYPGALKPAGMLDGDIWDQRLA